MDIQKHRFLYIHIFASREEVQVAGVAYGSMPSCLKPQCTCAKAYLTYPKNTRRVILIDLE